jgi:hypothetical protein
LNVRNRAHAYIGSAKRCGACPQKAQCTSGRYKYLAIHIHESARQRARELANTPEFFQAQESRGSVCGTQESDRIAPLALTTYEVRSGAVLPGSSCAEHQAIGALPQSTCTPCSARHDLATEKNSAGQATKAKTSQVQRVFQHPQVAVEKLIR